MADRWEWGGITPGSLGFARDDRVCCVRTTSVSPWAVYAGGLDDETVWCGADVVKGKTGDERQTGIAGRAQYFDVLRADDSGANDLILIFALRGFQEDQIVLSQTAKIAKEGVAMRGKADIACTIRRGRSGNMTDGIAKSFVVGVLYNHGGERNAGN